MLPALEVAIGLAVLFLVVALASSSIVEVRPGAPFWYDLLTRLLSFLKSLFEALPARPKRVTADPDTT